MVSVKTEVLDRQTPESVSTRRVHMSDERIHWQTPGAVAAARVAAIPQVRLVLERPEPDRYSVFVVVDDDGDDVLDPILDAERELYGLFRNMPFDLRIMKPAADWDESDLVRSSAEHYRRP